MKRLIVIVEGETEESFVNNVLAPYLSNRGFHNMVQCFKLKHSHGGISKYFHLKTDILNVIYEKEAVVTTMIDYYRLPSDFPGHNEASALSEKTLIVSAIEESVKREIESTQNRRFDDLIPYVQLHEFEALIFSSPDGIEQLFDRGEYDHKRFSEVISLYRNPEEINNGPDTAPSVRLKKIIPGYDKVLYGVEMARIIGMETLLAKCPHFADWVNKLLSHLKN